jgi:hypothetical protein
VPTGLVPVPNSFDKNDQSAMTPRF